MRSGTEQGIYVNNDPYAARQQQPGPPPPPVGQPQFGTASHQPGPPPPPQGQPQYHHHPQHPGYGTIPVHPAPPPPTPKRPWYRKKRFAIPLGLLLFFMVIGAISGDPDTPASTTAGGQEVVEDKPSGAELEAEEELSAEELAAQEAAAAEEQRTKEDQEAAAAEAERIKNEQEAAAAAAAEAAKGTVSQQNAYRSAESYLDMTGFSRKELIDQLLYEQFSPEDAEFGVARIEAEGGVDWNAEAAESAKSYLEMTAFSRGELLDQLLYEGFSPEQAEYGVSRTGL